MEQSESVKALAKALVDAQIELRNAKLDGFNPHFKNKYATLASVRETVVPVFAKFGLAVVQTCEPHGDAGVCVVTTVLHESGEWMRGKLFMPVEKKNAQNFGAAISYARRFSLGAVANIATDEDDDGEQASKASPVKAPPAKSDVDADALVRALEEAKNAEELSAASLAVGRARSKLSKPDLERCRAAHDTRMRALEGGEAA